MSLDDYFGEDGQKKSRKPMKKKAVKRPDKSLDHISPVGRKKPKRKKRDTTEKAPPPGVPVTDSKPDTRDQLLAVKWFFDEMTKGDEPIYIGIDPGSEGAIAFIHPKNPARHTVVDMPVNKVETSKKTKKGNKQQRTVYDIATIWEYFKIIKEWRHRVVICIEKMQPRNVDTPLTGFSMGSAFFMWPLFLYSHDIVYEEIMPVVWKRTMGLLKKDKEASRFAAQKLFPSAPLSRKGDDGRAEALLIAEAAKRRRHANAS